LETADSVKLNKHSGVKTQRCIEGIPYIGKQRAIGTTWID